MILFLMFAYLQAAPPPSPVAFDYPQGISVSATYECQGRAVLLSYRAKGWPSEDPHGIWITSYTSGDIILSEHDLLAINESLGEIERFRYIEFRCQNEGRALIDIVGNDKTGREIGAHVRIDGGRVYIPSGSH